MQHADQSGFDGGDTAARGRQQLGAERPQHGHGDDGEPDLPGKRRDGPADPGRVGTPPSLHREGSGGNQQGAVHDEPGGASAVQEGHEHGDDHRGAADEDAGDGRLGGAFRGEDGQVEADHSYGGEQGDPAPLAAGQFPQRCGAAAAEEGQEEQAGKAVADCLAPRVRIVAEDTVGGEGTADQDTGEGGEQRPSYGCGVHGTHARQ